MAHGTNKPFQSMQQWMVYVWDILLYNNKLCEILHSVATDSLCWPTFRQCFYM